MRRINVIVSEEAGEVLDEYQKREGHRSKDNALDALLLAEKKKRGQKK